MVTGTDFFVGWLFWAIFWNALKIPYQIRVKKAKDGDSYITLAAYLRLPHANKRMLDWSKDWGKDPKNINTPRCPLRTSPITRSKGWVRSPPESVCFHNVLCIIMDIIFVCVYLGHMRVDEAVVPLVVLFALQLPFFWQNCNNIPLPPAPQDYSKSVYWMGLGVIIPALFLLRMWQASEPASEPTSDFYGLSMFWNVVPFLELVDTTSAGKAKLNCCSKAEDDDYEELIKDNQNVAKKIRIAINKHRPTYNIFGCGYGGLISCHFIC